MFSISNAYGLEVRWTIDTEGLGQTHSKPDLQLILDELNKIPNSSVNARNDTTPKIVKLWSIDDFTLTEDRPLAFSHYYHWQQVAFSSSQSPINIDSKGIRLWKIQRVRFVSRQQLAVLLADGKVKYHVGLANRLRLNCEPNVSATFISMHEESVVPLKSFFVKVVEPLSVVFVKNI